MRMGGKYNILHAEAVLSPYNAEAVLSPYNDIQHVPGP
jgi:hypothetical protein